MATTSAGPARRPSRRSASVHVLIAAFVAWEARTDAPMIPLRLFRSRAFTAANIVSMLMTFGMFGSIFLLAQFFQVVQGYSPLEAGLRTLPWTFMPVIVAPIAGLISTRTGTRPLLVLGMALQAASLAWLSVLVTPTVEYLTLVPGVRHGRCRDGPVLRPDRQRRPVGRPAGGRGQGVGREQRDPGTRWGVRGGGPRCRVHGQRVVRLAGRLRRGARPVDAARSRRSSASVRSLPWPCRVERGRRVPRSTTPEPSARRRGRGADGDRVAAPTTAEVRIGSPVRAPLCLGQQDRHGARVSCRPGGAQNVPTPCRS